MQRQELRGREDAVAQVGFGDRAKADGGAAGGDAFELASIDVRRMHQTPAIIDARHVSSEPGHGAAAAPAQTVFHFFRLLGDVDMHGIAAGQADHRRELRRA